MQAVASSHGNKGRPAAYLDLAQEHLLFWMCIEGVFDAGYVVLKGGTAAGAGMSMY